MMLAVNNAREWLPRSPRVKEGVVGGGVPVDAAIVLEDGEDRVAARQVCAGSVRAPYRQRTGGFAQHEKTGRVIDLPIDQHDGAHGTVARRTCRLQVGIRGELPEDIGRRIDEYPGVFRIATHGDR